MKERLIPNAFLWRRFHSLLGLWLVVFLIQHLLVNSQAALLIGHDGEGFIHAANALESLPFVPVLEALLLAVPIVMHTLWGFQVLRTAEYNSFRTDGSTPSLPEFPRNRAYTWQRITSWLLVIGIAAHVVHMRFVERPMTVGRGVETSYLVRVQADAGLDSVAKRLGVQLLSPEDVKKEQWAQAVERLPLESSQVMVVAGDFGRAELLMLRNTFQQPVMLVLYTLLVLFACFHAFNGLWTALIKWGITLTDRSQRLLGRICIGLMFLVGFLGLAAVWGTYWINLRQ